MEKKTWKKSAVYHVNYPTPFLLCPFFSLIWPKVACRALSLPSFIYSTISLHKSDIFRKVACLATSLLFYTWNYVKWGVGIRNLNKIKMTWNFIETLMTKFHKVDNISQRFRKFQGPQFTDGVGSGTLCFVAKSIYLPLKFKITFLMKFSYWNFITHKRTMKFNVKFHWNFR